MTFRSFLYKLARLIGDVSAIKRGKVGQRVVNRGIGRILARTFRARR